jgi:DNA-binding FadR family transcriptional regulator
LGTAIRLGLLGPGTRLPPERELADQLSIARSTLRQAITALVQSGHLSSVRGRAGGTFVTEAPPLAGLEPVDIGGWRDVCDWRLAVETGCVALAAERATEEDAERLAELADRMDEVTGAFEEYRRADVLFHLTLAECTRVPRVVAAMTETQAAMTDLIAHIPHPPAVLDEANRQHRRIVECVRKGDPARSVKLVRDHLRGTEHVLAGLLPSG